MNIGVVVVDNKNDELYIRMRDNWSGFSDDEVEILGDLASDLQAKAVELGPLPLLAYLEDCLSNAILITERQTLSSDIEIDEELVNSLFSREVMRL